MNEKKKHGLDLIGAMLLGALVGAGTVILAKEENRKVVKHKVAEAIDSGEKKIDELLSKAEQLTAKQRRRLVSKLEEAKSKLKEE